VANGMSLRDYFAAAALQGELAGQIQERYWCSDEFDILAERMFMIADAMLKAREGGAK
jgi:hypothetical protein